MPKSHPIERYLSFYRAFIFIALIFVVSRFLSLLKTLNIFSSIALFFFSLFSPVNLFQSGKFLKYKLCEKIQNINKGNRDFEIFFIHYHFETG